MAQSEPISDGENNIIINTASIGRYIFKEPNIDFSGERIVYALSGGVNIGEDLFKNNFYNEELNNYFNIVGVSKPPLGDLLNPNLIASKKTTKQIYPHPKVAGFAQTHQRPNFIFQWKDDDYFSSSAAFVPNFNNTRQVLDGRSGYIINKLSGFNASGSIWPLDWYPHPTLMNQQGIGSGDKTIAGELMIGSTPNFYYRSATFNHITPAMRPYGMGVNYLPLFQEGFDGRVTMYYSHTLPWVAWYFANSSPFANSEKNFNNSILSRYKNYSQIGEFNVSSLITDENFTDLTSFLFSSSFIFDVTGSHPDLEFNSLDLNLKNKNVKALEINLSTISKLRPYDGFYPCQYTLIAAQAFSQSLAKYSEYNSYFFQNINYVDEFMYLYFGPGVLYNSIKAGMPMAFINQIVAEDSIAEFDTIFDPIQYMKNKNIDNIFFTGKVNATRYQNIIKNFLTEIRFSFCKNNSLNYFNSKNETDFESFDSGTTYGLDIELSTGKVDFWGNEVDNQWIGGVNYVGKTSNYIGNNPAWYQMGSGSYDHYGLSNCRVLFTPTETRVYTLNEIFALSTVEYRFNKLEPANTSELYRQKLTESFNIFNKTTVNGNNKWQINSKWEFPFLAMTSTIMTYSFGMVRHQRRYGTTGNKYHYLGGMWHDYCEIPSEDQGLFIELSNVEYSSGSILIQSASLAEKVGFEINNKKRVGELNETLELNEVIVLLPLIKNSNSLFFIDSTFDCYEDNKKYLKEYMFPPVLDYLKFDNKAALFFCIEIKELLNKKNISYFWQNVLPKINPEFKEINDKLKINDEKIIALFKDKETYFKVFKCKKRSKSNPHGVYGYNWPYDWCSIAELTKIDITIEE